MKTLILLVLFSLISAQAPSDEDKLYLRSAQQFASSIYEKQKERNVTNFLFSPSCIQSFLALLHAGAEGETATEISKFLPTGRVQDIFVRILASDQNNAHYTLKYHHVLFIQEGYRILDTFNRTAYENYGANIEFLNFTGDFEGMIEQINLNISSLVSIDNFFTSNEVKGLNFFVTSSFKFASNLGVSPVHRRFRTTFYADVQKEVEVGELVGSFNYLESQELDARLLQLPFAYEECLLTIVLPNKINGFAALEERLPEILEQKNFTKQKVAVQLPDFRLESKTEVAEVLKELGIRRVFNKEYAQLGGISDTQRLFLSQLLQESYFRMLFESTPQTQALLKRHRSICPSSDGAVVFKVDRPYITFISIKRSGSIIILGRTLDPTVS